ncbi:hypothetical protein [Streptomyces atratus]|uniref:hypothetical protein n=1 Tax=Streptomyces atratus TaxID=1893 RepID=UPI00364DFCE2
MALSSSHAASSKVSCTATTTRAKFADAAKSGSEVSVTAIARRAGVDRTFLYRHRDLLSQIHAQATAPAALPGGRGPAISRAMPHLVAARLVTVVRRGRFQLHPMIAAFNDSREQQRAVKALPRDMRLDVGDFEDEYERRFQLHLDEKARKAEAKAKGNVTPITKPTRLKRVH